MGVDYFSCDNCHEAHSEYNEIWCEGEHQLCNCAMPQEIEDICGATWDNIHDYITYGKEEGTVEIRSELVREEDEKVFQKYLSSNDDYGIVLKKEYCPLCQRIEKNKQDPEYEEYLRLKRKFEDD